MQQNEHSNGMNGKRHAVRPPIIRVEQFTKHYYLGRTVVPALRGINLEVQQGEFVALMGPSGSGKSTFMNLLGCLDRPTSGSYLLDGVPVSKMNADQLADIRNQKIGFVFQSFNLLSWMTALDNVELPLVYSGIARKERQRRAERALSIVGLKARSHHRPVELSGGQQQRVAIARALVTLPTLFLADEPTGNLDSQTSEQIITILQELNARGLTIVLVTHEPDIARYAHRQVKFRDGRIVADTGTIPGGTQGTLDAISESARGTQGTIITSPPERVRAPTLSVLARHRNVGVVVPQLDPVPTDEKQVGS